MLDVLRCRATTEVPNHPGVSRPAVGRCSKWRWHRKRHWAKQVPFGRAGVSWPREVDEDA